MSRWKPWLAAALWAALIFILSTDTFSSAHTSQAISPFLRWLLPHASDDTLETLNLLVRKCAHLVEYSILSVLLLRAVRGAEHGWKLRWALIVVAIAALYACGDEFHQSFVPSRTAAGWDVLLDTCAAAAAQLAAWAWLTRGKRHSDEAV